MGSWRRGCKKRKNGEIRLAFSNGSTISIFSFSPIFERINAVQNELHHQNRLEFDSGLIIHVHQEAGFAYSFYFTSILFLSTVCLCSAFGLDYLLRLVWRWMKVSPLVANMCTMYRDIATRVWGVWEGQLRGDHLTGSVRAYVGEGTETRKDESSGDKQNNNNIKREAIKQGWHSALYILLV